MVLLSPRQRQCLDLRCRDGLTADEIGERLFISAHAVRNYLVDAYRAFGVASGARKAQVACFRFGQIAEERNDAPDIVAARAGDV